jgi:hypothetical protein
VLRSASPRQGGEGPALTPRTVSDRSALRGELARVRARGWATGVEELEPGFTAVAVPVLARDGRVVAALDVRERLARRSLIHTLDVPCMKEKTLRHPGHVQLMAAFRETGLFSKEPRQVGGARVRPLDPLADLLFPMPARKIPSNPASDLMAARAAAPSVGAPRPRPGRRPGSGVSPSG